MGFKGETKHIYSAQDQLQTIIVMPLPRTSACHQCVHVVLHALIEFIRPSRAGLLAQLALRSGRR